MLVIYLRRFINKFKSPLKVYWMVENIDGKHNFGDEITPYIIESIFNRKCVRTSLRDCSLICAGSIIEVAQNDSNGNVIKVWGSGFIKDGKKVDKSTNLDFCAVRGPLSAERVAPRSTNVTLGDPGILANRVFKASNKKKYDIGIIPHYADYGGEQVEEINRLNKNCHIISPLQTPEKIAYDITSCRLILSSSLHGLIFSDSFNVPNYWMPLSNKVVGNGYKFMDYYRFSNREIIKKNPSVVSSNYEIERAIEEYVPIHNLKLIQDNLIKAFPF